MHVLSVAHSYPRWDGDVAGAFIERLVRALRARGHGMTVLVPADAGIGGVVQEEGYTLIRARYAPARWETLAYRGTMARATRSPTGLAGFLCLVTSMVWRILAESKRRPVDLVHAHWWVPAGVAAWLARRLGGPPFIVTLHGTDVAVLRQSRIARWLAHRVLANAARVTAVSNYLADRAAKVSRLDRTRFAVQTMPVDVARFARQSEGGGGVVTVGRLERQKRIDLLIDAVAQLRAGEKAVALTIVGDGSERKNLEQRALDAGIGDTTRFVGFVAPARIPEVLGDADVFVFPAVEEGLGLAVVEALMAGVPVIAAADGGGAVEPVPANAAGRLVDPRDRDALARSISELLGNQESLCLAREAGMALKRELDPDRVAEVFEALYQAAAEPDRS